MANLKRPSDLQILYHDRDYVAIDKPAGLLVHRSSIAADAREYALQTLRDQLNQPVYPCHRLDRPTSGVLLFALSPEANHFAQKQFQEHRTEKTYLAVVRGWPADSGEIDYPLRSEDNPTRVSEAQTSYLTLVRSEINISTGRYKTTRVSLVELKPRTGRKHQIRRHLAHLRHPILGDSRHGDGAHNRFLREHCEMPHLMLRATELEIEHPSNGGKVCIRANPDSQFEDVLARLDLR